LFQAYLLLNFLIVTKQTVNLMQLRAFIQLINLLLHHNILHLNFIQYDL